MDLKVEAGLPKKIDEQAAEPASWIAHESQVPAAFQRRQHVGPAPFLGNETVSRLLAEFHEPAVEVRIVEIAGDDTHRKSEHSERADGNFPISIMPAHDDHGPPAAEEPHVFIAAFELDHVGTIIEPQLPPHLHDLDDHPEEMHPHAADDVVDLGLAVPGPEGLPDVVAGDVVAREFPGQQSMHD